MPATGKIVQITGPVVDLEFPPDQLPEIYNAVNIPLEGDGGRKVVCEVQQHLGNDWVRAVSMSTTDGLRRGMAAIDTGAAIAVPVGMGTLGRIFNVIGEPIDEAGPVETTETYPIHRPSPSFEDQAPAAQVFETGMKVGDLIAPFAKGGTIG
ncbi:MAG TPA: F0F1 ATP synthase subunit beta, partial [Chloroflexia bacterium]|nr:F0F1 ATP synthase subunit beta [Chloroflexia bacterium]